MKVAAAILLVCVAVPQAFGFIDFPSIGNEAIEGFKKAGNRVFEHVETIKEEARRQKESIQKAVQEKAESLRETIKQQRETIERAVQEPTKAFEGSKLKEKFMEMLREMKKSGSWEEGKKQLKKLLKNEELKKILKKVGEHGEGFKQMLKKAGERGEEFLKIWEEKKGNWSENIEVAEKRWQKMKEFYGKFLKEAKQKIISLEEQLEQHMPDSPLEELKTINMKINDILKSFKTVFKLKVKQIKEQFELEPSSEPETEEEEMDPEIPEEAETAAIPTEVPETSGSEVMGEEAEQPEESEEEGDDDNDDDDEEEEEVPLPAKEDEEPREEGGLLGYKRKMGRFASRILKRHRMNKFLDRLKKLGRKTLEPSP